MKTVFYTSFERAVIDLERAVYRDRSHVVLATSPGPGCATLTRVLEERFAGTLRALELPIPTAGRDEICARILHELGADRSTVAEDLLPGRLRELATAGSALVLLIRDADSMPAATLSWLGRLAAESNKGLRLVLVVTVDGGSKAELIPGLIAALGVGAQKVVLEELGERVAGASLSGSPGAHVGAASTWANPLRSRLETIRAVTVRPQSRRGTRWQVYVALAAATVLVGLELQRAIARPEAVAPAIAKAESLEAPVVATHPRPAPRTSLAEPASQLSDASAAQAVLAEAGEVSRRRELAEVGVVEVGEEEREAVEEGLEVAGERVEAAKVAGGEQPDVSDVALATEPENAEPVTTRKVVGTPSAAQIAPQSWLEAASEPEAEPSSLLHVATFPAKARSKRLPTLGSEIAAPPASPVAAVSSRAVDDSFSSTASQPEAPLESRPTSDALAPSPVEPEQQDVRTAVAADAPLVEVSVNARPWARIQVDGRDVGITPLSGLEMSPGRHLFRARLPDGRELEKTVHVDQYRDRISFP